jgi:hypothetical protein
MAATHAPHFEVCTKLATKFADCGGHMFLAGLQSGQPVGCSRLGSFRKHEKQKMKKKRSALKNDPVPLPTFE